VVVHKWCGLCSKIHSLCRTGIKTSLGKLGDVRSLSFCKSYRGTATCGSDRDILAPPLSWWWCSSSPRASSNMSGQRSADDGDVFSSGMAGGCAMREGDSVDNRRGALPAHSDGLAVFTWGRGEDGQLGLGDTADQDEPTYVRDGFVWCRGLFLPILLLEFCCKFKFAI
jgi:Regulator of chromosome condensation (RCC1) repeat